MTTEPYFWTDSHCHPHFPQLGDNIADVLKEMKDNNVHRALTVATTGKEWARVKQLARDYPGVFYAACGVHPLSSEDEQDDEKTLTEICATEEVLAIGETGLDFFRGKESEAMQRQRFAAHIAVARKLRKPLIIHARDSLTEILDMLRAENARDVGGVLHCFTGGQAEAKAGLDINFIISFSGIVTFKKTDDLRALAAATPADGYMVETDAPYLAPTPHRGKINTPGWTRHVGEMVAVARSQDPAKTAAETEANFNRLFAPPKHITDKNTAIVV